MKKGILSTCIGLYACAALGAQADSPIAYPQGSTKTSTGHVAPLGHDATRTFDECRFQQLVPARFLPTQATRLVGLDVPSATIGTPVDYKRLIVTLSHSPADGLGLKFAANLAEPVVVFDATDVRLTFEQDTWTRLTFDAPFDYDGESALVIEFRKRIGLTADVLNTPFAATLIDGNQGRSDLPTPRYVASALGDGAFDAGQATHSFTTPLVVRLVAETPTLTVASDPGGTSGNAFALGGEVVLEAYGKSGTLSYAIFAAPAFGPLLPTPIVDGRTRLPFPFVFTAGTGTIAGGPLRFTVPDAPSLVGFHAVFQGVVVDFVSATLQWTNATDLIVNP